ncbi:methyl-accepting chemotaxis protein [Microcoleus sp. FACHB-SPT15]|uniref:methyl-accepting chemotaxis protein n=1 Tax=Microcoleus sp. FACHB-SPT15 TaxID=2692830 RepID=UPI00177D2F97|nr:methyl-accepting chemotaxis protein [Microcoleus sp. FACHB-SPT15]MBD1808093.1 methyl-accepting chemotaxis protein [Microcoleus sp. FACHB-SPT15]
MFQGMTLKRQLFSAFLFMGLIVLVIALIGWSGTSRLTRHIQTIGDNAMPSAIALLHIDTGQTEIQSAERGLLNTRLDREQRDALATAIETAQQQVNTNFEAYEALPRSSEEDRLYKSFLRNWERWQQTSEEFRQLNTEFERSRTVSPFKTQINLLTQGRENSPEFAAAAAASQLVDRMVDQTLIQKEPAYNAVKASLDELINLNQNLGIRARKLAFQDVSQITFWVILGILIGPLTAILFGIYFSNTIARPLGKKITGVVEVAERISEGDLTSQVELASERDEIGKLLAAFHVMTQNLNSLIRQVQQSGIQITTSTTQIAASGKELEAAITEQLASTNEVVATAREIAINSDELVKTMDEVTDLSQSTANAASRGQKDLIRMQSTMRKLAEATTSISARLGVISEKANNINSIVSTITKVADQTNLLSLNAAIEAEKAREYGLGFAVVAREIRRLADQTAVATLDIESMVKEMQSAVSTGVMEMDKFTKEVQRGVEDVGNIGSQLGQIIEQVQSLTPRFELVGQGMNTQSQSAQQISEAMIQLREASLQTADALRETNNALEQLDDAAQNLRQETSSFKVSNQMI